MGSIDAFRLSPEVKKEAWHYARTGGVVDDAFWRSLEARYRADPGRFAADHPNVAGYLAPPAVLGRQPDVPAVEFMRHRIAENGLATFTAHHHFWGRLLAREPSGRHDTLVPPVPVVPGCPPPSPSSGDRPGCPVPSGAVPEPSSICLAFAAVAAFLVRRSVCSLRPTK